MQLITQIQFQIELAIARTIHWSQRVVVRWDVIWPYICHQTWTHLYNLLSCTCQRKKEIFNSLHDPNIYVVECVIQEMKRLNNICQLRIISSKTKNILSFTCYHSKP